MIPTRAVAILLFLTLSTAMRAQTWSRGYSGVEPQGPVRVVSTTADGSARTRASGSKVLAPASPEHRAESPSNGDVVAVVEVVVAQAGA